MKDTSIEIFLNVSKQKADGGVVTEQSRTENFLSSILTQKYA